MNLNSISPYVRRAMHSQLRGPFCLGQRVIFDYELIYIAAGRMRLRYDGKEYICRKGDVILLRPGVPHTLLHIDGKPVTQPHIHFDMIYDDHSDRVYISFKDLPSFTEEERTWIREDVFAEAPIGPILHIADKEGFVRLFYEIIEGFSQKRSLYPLLCKEMMLRLLSIVIKDNTVSYEAEPKTNQIAALIKHYIDYNYLNPLSLESLEDQFNYSKFHISRVFAAYTGSTVIQYYNQKRVEHAKRMLREGASVSEASAELHCSSIYAFSRYFKNLVGVSPSEYQKNRP